MKLGPLCFLIYADAVVLRQARRVIVSQLTKVTEVEKCGGKFSFRIFLSSLNWKNDFIRRCLSWHRRRRLSGCRTARHPCMNTALRARLHLQARQIRAPVSCTTLQTQRKTAESASLVNKQ